MKIVARDTTIPVTGAIYHNHGNEKLTERLCFELRVKVAADKYFTSVFKEKCAMLNIVKFKFSCLEKTFSQHYQSGQKREFFKLTHKSNGRLPYHIIIISHESKGDDR